MPFVHIIMRSKKASISERIFSITCVKNVFFTHNLTPFMALKFLIKNQILNISVAWFNKLYFFVQLLLNMFGTALLISW